MHFVVDPGPVTLALRSWFFLALLCVVVPLTVLRQHHRMQSGAAPEPGRIGLYAGAFLTHVGLLALSWSVLDELGAGFQPYHPRWWHTVVGLVALAAGLTSLLRRFEHTNPVGDARVRLLAPRGRGEFALFYAVCLSAGVAEELAFRGVLFTLFAALTGGWWVPALLAAIVFGVVHVFQGWRSAGLAGLMGLREQIVVGLTGTLVVAMAVHVAHNAIAGTVVARRVSREDRDVRTSPATEAVT